MKRYVFDIEADGLEPTKIHCLTAAVYSKGDWRIRTTTDYDEMRSFLQDADELIGHNIIRWDIPNLERLLGIKIEARLIDTLAISWYLYPDEHSHGLEDWGEHFGVPKPTIDNWEDLPIEDYIHRCEEDVKINCKLWDKQWKDLTNLYEEDEDECDRLTNYLMFKMTCARAAEKSKWKLDVENCKKYLAELELEKEDKIDELRAAMPKVETVKVVEPPESFYKAPKKQNKPKTYKRADGSLSKAGERYKALCESIGEDPETAEQIMVPSRELTVRAINWLDLLQSQGLTEDHKEPVEYISSIEDGNPNSIPQIKDWLFSLGWKPISFKYKDDRAIPQLRIERDNEKILCPSVQKLFDKEPRLKALDGLSVLTHRIGILKGYLSNMNEKGYVEARIQGFTNTLRFKHRVVVNLPSVKKVHGDKVRGVLIARKGYELCGSDMSSLEDRTKQHYMWDYDPDYVKEMQTDDFDPHLALAEFAGALTPEQVKQHKNKEKDFGAIRHLYKTANYSCTYGAGAKTLAITLDIPVMKAKAIVKAYRDKNWAIDAIAEDCVTKKCLGSMWLYNPVSGFWYSLRHKKDRFSTLNQGTGVYCFDTWIGNFMKVRHQLTGQMHDEVILEVRKGNRDLVEKMLKKAIRKTNRQLKLNRELGVDVQFGNTYAEIH